MEENKKSKKGLIIGGACIILLVAAFVLTYALTRPETNKGAKTITVQIVMGNDSREVEINTDAEYLKEALEEKDLVKGTGEGNKFYITQVDDVAADNSKQQWWAISKDGTMADTGAAEIVIKDGDHFELTLKTGY